MLWQRCETEAEWKQATQYYQVSSLTPDAVVERLDLQCPGLVPVVSALLLNPNTPPLTAAQVWGSENHRLSDALHVWKPFCFHMLFLLRAVGTDSYLY